MDTELMMPLVAPNEPLIERLEAFEAPDALLGEILAVIAGEFPEIGALVLGDRSGLPIASTFRGPSSLRTTAMATLTLSAAMKVTDSLSLPGADGIAIEAGAWTVLVRSLGDGFTLSAVVSAEGDTNRIKARMRSCSYEILSILAQIA